MSLSLAEALRVDSSQRIAFIGAGGKTTALFQLARQLPPPVIVTAASHLGAWQLESVDRHIITESAGPLEELEHGLSGVILITGEVDGDRSKPIHPNLLNWLREFCGYHTIPLLIEADGSRSKPLKAWAEHEPPLPSFVDLVVQVVGLRGLGKALDDENVHRPQVFSRLSGLPIGEVIAPEQLVKVLTHPEGGLRNVPASARRVVLLNQADTEELQSTARSMSTLLMPAYHAVVISRLENEQVFAVHEPIVAIILAAGESTRFGRAKQLLDWRGQPFVRAVARTALEAGLAPVLVVTGANAEEVASAVSDLSVMIVRNAKWKTGQGSSIRAGLSALTPDPSPKMGDGNWGGAIFLLVDQPQVTTSVLRALVEKHAEGLYPIVAPMVIDRRANPVLFDRATFPELMRLEGDVGGRAIFHNHRVEYLPWHDDRLLLDVDTPEMYERLISDETL
jgi:molybdenum cofactor cytidylyltransferase